MARRSNLIYWLLGGGVLAAIAMTQRKLISDVGAALLEEANDAIFKLAIPSEAEPYSDVIKQVASEKSVDPLLIAALGMRESDWGQTLSPQGPGGTGDAGHGHGLMQIDDRTWDDWLASNDWTDPYTNVSKGVDILQANIDYFAGKGLTGVEGLAAALAAYNAGPGNVWAAVQKGQSPDSVTTKKNYSSWVLDRLASYTSTAKASLGMVA